MESKLFGKSVLTGIVLLFAAVYAVANPEIVPFVGDSQTLLRPDRVYTHALDFGERQNYPIVNGVQFTSTRGNGPGWRGFPDGVFGFQEPNNILSPSDSGIYQVLGDFNYGISNGSIYFDNLTPGKVYEVRFYHRVFGGPRTQTFTFKPDAETALAYEFDPDKFSCDEMLVYRYTAGSTSLEIHCYSHSQDDTYHFYGVVNEQVYDITPGEVTKLAAASARLNGLAITGGEESTVTAFWQPAEATDWDAAESAELMTTEDGDIYFDISDLTPETEYRFRMSMTNELRSALSETMTFLTYPDTPVFSVNTAQVAGATATLGGTLLYCGPGAQSVDVTLFWGTDPEALNKTVLLEDVESGAFSTKLVGLDYGTSYYYRFKAQNADNSEAWQEETGWFATLGAPAWGDFGAETTGPGTLELWAILATPGVTNSTITCWFGETPETMQAFTNWPASYQMDFICTMDGLEINEDYYYAFHALCEPDELNSWSVWSTTNKVRVLELPPLLPALTEGYYNTLLHLGADYLNDVINNNALYDDQLTDFGGQAAQAPWPGLTYSGLPVQVGGPVGDLTWTVVTKEGYDRWNMNRDSYVKYWHIYIINPDAGSRDARIHYTVDDDLLFWRNGELILAAPIGTSSANITLHPGVNSITIKFREGTGADYCGFRITDRDNAPFEDLRYSFTASVLGVPTAPPMLELTHNTVTIAPDFTYNHSPDPFYLYVVCDVQDHGAALADWRDSPTCRLQTFRGITEPPASIVFEDLTPDTKYVVRYFTVKQGFEERSLPLEFNTFAMTAAITSLPPTNDTGLSATANAYLGYCGPGLDTADVYFYWWDEDAVTNSVVKHEQFIGDVAIDISGLWYSQTYGYNFAASNHYGFAWSPEPVQFTTIGEPIFGEVSDSTPQPDTLKMDAEVTYPGPVSGTITCWFGTDPDNLANVDSDILNDPDTASFTQSGLQVGGVYYYAFQIQSSVTSGDQSISWDVWTSTNSVMLSGSTSWTAGGGADTDWYTATNWDYGVPGPGGTAAFPLSDVRVTADTDIAVNNVNILGSGVIFDLGDFPLNVAGTFTVGVNADWRTATLASGRLNANEFIIGNGCNNCSFTVEPGAELTTASTTSITRNGDRTGNELIIRGLFNANGINIGDGGGWGGTAYMTVDGGTVTNKTATNIGPWAGNGHILELRNNAHFVQTSGTFKLGHRASNCRIHVYDGSELDVTGNLTVNVGTDWGGSTGYIIVSNSALNVTGSITLGQHNSGGNNTILLYEDPGCVTIASFGGNLNVNQGHNGTHSSNHFGIHGGTLAVGGEFQYAASCSDNSIHITRPASLFTANTLNLRGSSTLTWSLSPGDVFGHPQVEINQNAAFSADTLIEVDLGKFTGRATLFQSSTGDLSEDAVSVSQNPGYEHKLVVNPNLLKVSSWIPSVFILR